MTNKIQEGNLKMAEFLGWEQRMGMSHRGKWNYNGYYASNGALMCKYNQWNPHTDLNQAMQVVDKICKQTGWTDGNGSQGEDNVSYFAIFEKYHQDQWIPFILGESEIRVQAISIACLKAIDHIEKQTS